MTSPLTHARPADAARAHVAVVGSLVLDLVSWVPRLPRRGETVMAERFATHPGGKGFNQALAIHRGGGRCTLVGRLGDDPFADPFEALFDAEGWAPGHVRRHREAGTALGMPVVDAAGDNHIVLAPRANATLTPEDVDDARGALEDAAVLVLQLEVPAATSAHAAELARRAGGAVLLNPAPWVPEVRQLVGHEGVGVDWLAPNQTEAQELLGSAAPIRTLGDAAEAAEALLAALGAGVRQGVVVTAGDQGAAAASRAIEGAPLRASAVQVDAVDATGAGDAFVGAFALALAEGADLAAALARASAAGALAVTVAGAAPSMPTSEAVAATLAASRTL